MEAISFIKKTVLIKGNPAFQKKEGMLVMEGPISFMKKIKMKGQSSRLRNKKKGF
jgi:hypothetical protein